MTTRPTDAAPRPGGVWTFDAAQVAYGCRVCDAVLAREGDRCPHLRLVAHGGIENVTGDVVDVRCIWRHPVSPTGAKEPAHDR